MKMHFETKNADGIASAAKQSLLEKRKMAASLRAQRSNLCYRNGISVKMYAEGCGRRGIICFYLGCRSYGALIITTDGYFYQPVAPTELGENLCDLCAAFATSAVKFLNRKESRRDDMIIESE